VLAILLAAIPLLRGGFPWMPPWRAPEPAVAPPGAAQPAGTPAPAAPEQSAEPIAVSIDAVPWASIEVDGKYLGVTPLADVRLSPGPHLFRAQLPGGEIRERRVEVGAATRRVVFEAERKPEPETKPPAEPAPPIPAEVPEIAVEAVPYLERELPEITGGPDRELSASQSEPAAQLPASELISVSINATPWATIEIDGEEVGMTPMAGVLLTPGDHEFRVIMADGTILNRTVRIAPDNRHIAFFP
jgi:hypothetical protein